MKPNSEPIPARPNRVASWLGCLMLALLALATFRLTQRLDALENSLAEQKRSLATLDESVREAQATLGHQPQVEPVPSRAQGGRPEATAQWVSRLVAVENQMRQLRQASSVASRGSEVPEYDPAQPAPEEPEPEPEPANNKSWSAWQATGIPNTPVAGDAATAWASQGRDDGPEWLQVGFTQEVEVAEVRVRETYNAGAISRITAWAGGTEVTLWEGMATPAKRVRDFVVRPAVGVVTGTITIHLDTSRVPGWNELDAVELVGRDGSRQWGASARASSSYGAGLAGDFQRSEPLGLRLTRPAEAAP